MAREPKKTQREIEAEATVADAQERYEATMAEARRLQDAAREAAEELTAARVEADAGLPRVVMIQAHNRERVELVVSRRAVASI